MTVEGGKKKHLQVWQERFAHRMYLEGRGRSLSKRVSNSLNYYHEIDYKNNDVDFIDDNFDPHTQGMSKRGYFPLHIAAKRPNFIGQNMIDWEAVSYTHLTLPTKRIV